MKVSQLSFSFAPKEIVRVVYDIISPKFPTDEELKKEFGNYDVAIKSNFLVITMKRRAGGVMPYSLGVCLSLRPADDGFGIVFKVEKASAGIIKTPMLIDGVMSQFSQIIDPLPGCRVSGREIIVTKDALTERFSSLDLSGKITAFRINGDLIEFSFG